MSPSRGSEGSNPSLSAIHTPQQRIRTDRDTGADARDPRGGSGVGRANRSPRPAAHTLATSCALLALLVGWGCAAERTLTITSEPEGALVRLDDDLIGETPLVVPFLHYGTRRVTFYLDGYQTRSVLYRARPPWYGRFPLDIVTEVLIPIGWEDDHPVHVDLVPGVEAPSNPYLRGVIDRAEILRRAGPSGPPMLPPGQGVPGTASELLPPLHEDETVTPVELEGP